MTYDLAIGDRAYSSWSLRGWLLLAAFDLPVRVHRAQMRTPEFPALLARFAPARTVPALRTPDGAVATDSLAIAEELASRHPEAGHWPADPGARALARSLAAEMHSGFAALRGACPMNLRQGWQAATSAAVRADLDRLGALWSAARAMAGAGPWLFGPYGAVDAFFAPVAMRIAGYALPVEGDARAYVDAHLRHPPLLAWRDAAMGDGPDQAVYEQDLPRRPFPWPDRAGR
ncbi:MAG: glutathione S-transferase N-terminal domain-containing protein [Hasllibacter sp.]